MLFTSQMFCIKCSMNINVTNIKSAIFHFTSNSKRLIHRSDLNKSQLFSFLYVDKIVHSPSNRNSLCSQISYHIMPTISLF